MIAVSEGVTLPRVWPLFDLRLNAWTSRSDRIGLCNDVETAIRARRGDPEDFIPHGAKQARDDILKRDGRHFLEIRLNLRSSSILGILKGG